MSNSISPYSGNRQPTPLSYVPGTFANRERRETAELERRRQHDIEDAAHQHGLKSMELHNDAVRGELAAMGAGRIMAAGVYVAGSIASDLESALIDASPIKAYAIENFAAAVLPEFNRVVSSHVANQRP